MNKFIILLCILSNTLTAQIKKTTNNQYIIHKTDLQVLDQLAKKGKECDKSLTELIASVDIVTYNSRIKDTVMISIQKQLYNIKGDFQNQREIVNDLAEKNIKLTADLRISEKEISKQKKNNYIIGGFSIASILAVIILLK
jgi:septation ring formation regulator EzrA